MDKSSQCGRILSWLQESPYRGLSWQRKDWRTILLESRVLRIYSSRHVFQVDGSGSPTSPPCLLDVSRRFLLTHQNLWTALSLEKFIGKLWPSNASLHKGLHGQEVTPFVKPNLYAFPCPQTWPHLKVVLFMRKGLTRSQRGTSGICSSS